MLIFEIQIIHIFALFFKWNFKKTFFLVFHWHYISKESIMVKFCTHVQLSMIMNYWNIDYIPHHGQSPKAKIIYAFVGNQISNQWILLKFCTHVYCQWQWNIQIFWRLFRIKSMIKDQKLFMFLTEM